LWQTALANFTTDEVDIEIRFGKGPVRRWCASRSGGPVVRRGEPSEDPEERGSSKMHHPRGPRLLDSGSWPLA
jgi:hypothetical protein